LSELAVLFHADGVVAVDKPAGRLVIPGRGEASGPSLREQLERELGKPVWVVHRLDRDTTGVLLFALDAQRHRTLSMAFEGGRVEKRYHALVDGQLVVPIDLDVPLKPARRGRMRPARADEDEAKPARTLVRPLETHARGTLVEAQPLTGRTHQIRVHLLSAGHPLLVDPQYGQPESLTARALGGAGEELVLARTPLHAERVFLRGLESVRDCEIVSPLPDDMRRALELLRI
jgi:tRNA pseudouridine32 synthase/23S rRNA pseudouridine746 synthase